MRFDVITLFPDWIRSWVDLGVTGRAIERGLITVNAVDPRDFADDERGTVDDRPFGGGPGMVMSIEPMRRALAATRKAGESSRVVYLSPTGRVLDDDGVRRLAREDAVTLICGRYEGLDQRLIDKEVDEELSIGDYVLSGGEIAATVVIDAVSRLQDGVLGKAASAEQDSFANDLLDHPHYTRPQSAEGYGDVPEVLLGGDHGVIARWRRKQALGKTWVRRSDLLSKSQLSDEDRELLREFIREMRTGNN